MTTWTPEEQKAHRKLWVEALRSGRYQQGRDVLQTSDGRFCCLGVACDLSALGSWGDPLEGGYMHPACCDYKVGSNEHRSALPIRVMQWLGLSDSNGAMDVPHERGFSALTSMNDGGLPFAQIADLIESEPEGLIAQPVVV